MMMVLDLGAGMVVSLLLFGFNFSGFSATVSAPSAPPALGYSRSPTVDPPEIEPHDGSLSDDPLNGPNEMLEEPKEVERPV